MSISFPVSSSFAFHRMHFFTQLYTMILNCRRTDIQLLHENRLNFCTFRWKRRLMVGMMAPLTDTDVGDSDDVQLFVWNGHNRWHAVIHVHSCSHLQFQYPFRTLFSPALLRLTIQRTISRTYWRITTTALHMLTPKKKTKPEYHIVCYRFEAQEWHMRRNFTQMKVNRNE